MFNAASMLHVFPFLLSFRVNAGRGLLHRQIVNVVTFIIFTIAVVITQSKCKIQLIEVFYKNQPTKRSLIARMLIYVADKAYGSLRQRA